MNILIINAIFAWAIIANKFYISLF